MVWLFPDDADTIHGKSADELKAKLSGFVPFVDDLVSSYVLALEADEYWGREKVMALGNHLNTLTNKPIGNHQKPGNFDYCVDQGSEWCDMMVYQYGWGKSTSEIYSTTANLIYALGGKKVIAGEYNVDDGESLSYALGHAALTAGAIGFGNGGY